MKKSLFLGVPVLVWAAVWVTGCGCPIGATEDVRMTPYFGRLGYHLEGPHDFVGSLTKESMFDAEWVLSGEFTFPTGGYAVGRPQVRIAESYPEQVDVALRVTKPAPWEPVTLAIMTVPVSVRIPASNEASFRIRVISVTRGLCIQTRR